MASSNTGGQSTPSLSELFGSIANAIRLKDGTTADIVANTFPDRIRAIQTGTDTSDATAAASDILSGKTAYVKGAKVTGNIASKTASNLTASGGTVTVPAGYYPSQVTKSVSTATQATPSISVDENGKITASAEQIAGYVTAGTKSSTLQLNTVGENDPNSLLRPGTKNFTAAPKGSYAIENIVVAGDARLKPENIKKGVSIFGVSGAYEGATGLAPATVTIGLSSALAGIMTMAAPMDEADLSYFGSVINEYSSEHIYLNRINNISSVVGSMLYLFTSNSIAQLQNAIELQYGNGGVYPSNNDHYIMITGPNAVIAFDPA